MLTFTLRMLYHMATGHFSKVPEAGRVIRQRFRAYPVDLDVYGHVNNACYLRVAELSRWHQLTRTRLLGSALRKRWMFIVAQQEAVYRKPIAPLQEYVVTTSIGEEDNKWLLYRHTFESPDGADLYAEVNVRAVMKHPSGRTVRPSEVAEDSAWAASMLERFRRQGQ